MIVFPSPSALEVSVVIPVYGGRKHLEQALGTLLAHTEPCYEVIVVDNASPDGTTAWVREHVGGIGLIANERNVGFGPAVNQGALHARGRSLCLLNSDAFVEPGWLPPLLEQLGRPGVGAVVPRLLNLDGTLQEAGGLVGRSGIGYALGSTDDPDRPRFRFRRTVDYGSGACLLLHRWLFHSVGGLDPVFGLAYCEDVDLAFRLAARGFRTVYEPGSTVRHVKGASSPAEHVVALRDANTATLRARWTDALARRPPLEDLDRYPHRVAAGRDADAPDRLLVACARLPGLPGTGDALGDLVGEIAGTWTFGRLALLTVEPADSGDLEPWLRLGVEVAVEPGGPRVWLRHRLLHFSAVLVADPIATGRLGADIRATQPQALTVSLGPDPDSDVVVPRARSLRALVSALAGAGWAPS
ncbi:MAG: glycosyltransferase family 2 protein [Acidimicrobiia bacterium]|nr:glycosyltransferase family 2 protein [Acidimicrobiia bacterium]